MGKEFAKHQEIAKELDISFYFCKPYHSWERGANENSPQKRLGYLTPNEKFNLLLTNQNSGCICKLNSPKKKNKGHRKILHPLIYFTLTSLLLENYSLLFHSGSLADKYCETYTFYLAYQEP